MSPILNPTMLHTNTRSPSRRHSSPKHSAALMEGLEDRKMMAVGPWVPYAQIIGQDQAFAAYPYLNGNNQTVALVDRGVDYRHPQLGNGSFGPGLKVVGGYNFRDANYNILDDYGHGTGVAGIIAADPYDLNGYNQGIAPNTHLLMLKQESSANIKAALDYIIQYHSYFNIQVVNLTDFVTDVVPGAWDPTLYTSELKTLHDLNIFITTPAGNGETFNNPAGNHVPIDLPGSSPYVFAAGGSTLQDTMWADSRRGAGLDLLAPSLDVTMTYYLVAKDGAGHPLGGYDQYDDNFTGTTANVNYAKGTSWASAYVAGTATLLKQINPAFTPEQITQILTQTGDQIADNENPAVFYPRLNVMRALNLGFQMADDIHAGNTNFSVATPLSFNRGKAAVTNARLVIGHPDNYTFVVNKSGNVNFNVQYAGATKPFTLVFDANGNIIKQIFSSRRGTNVNLRPGKYYVYLSTAQTLPGTYGITVSGGASSLSSLSLHASSVNTSTVSNAMVFSTQPLVTPTASSNVLFAKKDQSVFA
jgi:subtilisin family serine protease